VSRTRRGFLITANVEASKNTLYSALLGPDIPDLNTFNNFLKSNNIPRGGLLGEIFQGVEELIHNSVEESAINSEEIDNLYRTFILGAMENGKVKIAPIDKSGKVGKMVRKTDGDVTIGFKEWETQIENLYKEGKIGSLELNFKLRGDKSEFSTFFS
jgi:hypothetical protein